MKRRFWILCICCILVIISQAIFFAVDVTPGSLQDPVISKSKFLDTVNNINTSISKTNSNVAALQTKVDAIQATNESGSSTVSSSDLRIVAQFLKLNIDKKFGAINSKGITIKSSASFTASNVATLPYYAGVHILDAQSGWFKVSYYSYVGWVPYDKVTPVMLK